MIMVWHECQDQIREVLLHQDPSKRAEGWFWHIFAWLHKHWDLRRTAWTTMHCCTELNRAHDICTSIHKLSWHMSDTLEGLTHSSPSLVTKKESCSWNSFRLNNERLTVSQSQCFLSDVGELDGQYQDFRWFLDPLDVTCTTESDRQRDSHIHIIWSAYQLKFTPLRWTLFWLSCLIPLRTKETVAIFSPQWWIWLMQWIKSQLSLQKNSDCVRKHPKQGDPDRRWQKSILLTKNPEESRFTPETEQDGRPMVNPYCPLMTNTFNAQCCRILHQFVRSPSSVCVHIRKDSDTAICALQL